MVIVLNNYHFHHVVGFAFGYQGYTNLRLLKDSWAPLNYNVQIAAKVFFSCLCLLDLIVELHAMNENMFDDFLIG